MKQIRKKSFQKRHIVQLALLVLVLVVFANCTGSSHFGSQRTADDYRTGSSAVSMNFDRNSPPNQLIQDQQSVAVIRLQNQGAHPVENGLVNLVIDSSLLQITDNAQYKTFSLEGRSVSFPQGESTVVTFPLRSRQLSQESQVQDTQLVASTCYDYATQVLTDVCIDTDPYDLLPESGSKICSARSVNPGASGGPISVEQIDVSYSQQGDMVEPSFTITFRKSGSDLIYRRGMGAHFCTGYTSSQNPGDMTNHIEFRAVLSDQELFCTTNTLQLQNGRGTVTCQGLPIDIGQTQTFLAPMLIEIVYGVMSSTTKSLRIVR